MKFVAGERAQVPNEFYDSVKDRILSYIGELEGVLNQGAYVAPESFIALSDDAHLRKALAAVFAEKNTQELKYIFLCGIGGSSLGARALYESVFVYADKFCEHFPRIIFIDTVNASFLNHVFSVIHTLHHPEEFLFLIVTKSGTTVETVVNLELIADRLLKKFSADKVFSRFVCVTDEGSLLSWRAEEKNVRSLMIPKMVGGRFSVFSAAGMLPLSFVGFSVEKFHAHAREMLAWCLSRDLNDNPAFASAAALFYHQKNGKNIHNTFLFNPELEGFGLWYRQLLAESLGKKKNARDEEIHGGIIPLVSVGSVDLHSVAQLYLGGPRSIFTTFVWRAYPSSPQVPARQIFSLVPAVSGKNEREVMETLYESSKRAYEKEKLPFVELILHDVYDVGALLQFKMMEVIYLAHLLEENAFDQPAVEVYKEEARKIFGSM